MPNSGKPSGPRPQCLSTSYVYSPCPTVTTGVVNAVSPSASAQTRVQGIAQVVAEGVQGEHEQEDAHTWSDDVPRRLRWIRLGVLQRRAPGGGRRLNSEAEVAQTRFDQDRRAHGQSGQYQYGCQSVG